MTCESSRPVSENVQEFSGYVDLHCAQFRIQADTIRYDRQRKTVEAEGNVSLMWQANRLAGSRLTYGIETETGVVERAVGSFPPDIIVTADRIEKVSDDTVILENGEFTSCTQPSPYWAFKIRRGRFHLGHYAYLSGVSLRVRGVPVIYTPYLVWPIKGDRATGLLFPQWGTSRTLGLFAGDQLFWAIAPNADLTFQADYYDLAGPAGGIEFRWFPSARGEIELNGYGLNDRRWDEGRYGASLKGQQRFRGWKALAEINKVSDFRWYRDFESSLSAASNPATVSTLSLTNNWSYYSLAVRAQDRNQFFVGGEVSRPVLSQPGLWMPYPFLDSEVMQQVRPEIELRGRSRKMGRLPLYYSFESSVDILGREEHAYALDLEGDGTLTGQDIDLDGTAGGRFESDYGRLDLGTRLSLPLLPAPWLDVEAALTLRETYWTRSRVTAGEGVLAVDEPLRRTYAQQTLEFIGPKFSRVWEPAEGGAGRRFKHAVEPRVLWQFSPEMDYRELKPVSLDADGDGTPERGTFQVTPIPFDEIEVTYNAFERINQVTYGIHQRLLAKRPPAAITPLPSQRSRDRGAAGPPWGPGALEAPASETQPAAPAATPEGAAQTSGQTGPGEGASGERQSEAAGPSAAPGQGEPAPGWPYAATAPPPDTGGGVVPPGAGMPVAQGENAVEVASLDIFQTYSFETALSQQPIYRKEKVIDPATGEPVRDPQTGRPLYNDVLIGVETRFFSPVSIAARLNPSVNLSFDLRTDYDPLREAFTSEILSASARSGRLGYTNLSWVRRRGLDGSSAASSSTIMASGGTALLDRKLTLEGRFSFEQKSSRMLDWGVRVGYYTQCCGFIIEYYRRDFTGNERREFRFVVDLKGIGKFLDLNQGFGP